MVLVTALAGAGQALEARPVEIMIKTSESRQRTGAEERD